MAGSEVARLLQQIRAEEEAARRGLSGYALVSKHEFVTAHMGNMGRCMQELIAVTSGAIPSHGEADEASRRI